MTNTRREARTRNVAILAAPDAMLLDITGPTDVFSIAARFASAHSSEPAYRVEVVALRKGPVRTVSGLEIVASKKLGDVKGPLKPLLASLAPRWAPHPRASSQALASKPRAASSKNRGPAWKKSRMPVALDAPRPCDAHSYAA